MNEKITVKTVTRFTQEELFGRLRKLSMLKDTNAFPYANADFALVALKREDCWPAQRYVLSAELEKVQQLEWELARFDVDIFTLNGFVRMLVEDAEGEREIDLLPPVVEEWDIPGAGKLNILNDGMHRTYLSYQEWKIPQVVLIKNIPAQYPYYAYPLIDQWEHIDVIPDKEVPKGYIKKWHRISNNKLLYRDFNSSFRGVGAPRGKKTE